VQGDCSSNIDAEPYYDYTGSLRCLMEGAGDVSFTKHTIALDFTADGKTPAPWSSLPSGELRLLCPGAAGGCAPLSQAYRCHTSLATAHASEWASLPGRGRGLAWPGLAWPGLACFSVLCLSFALNAQLAHQKKSHLPHVAVRPALQQWSAHRTPMRHGCKLRW
jgi:hypothetical protein